MAEFISIGRTNFFAVKDVEAFKAELPDEVIATEDTNNRAQFVVGKNEGDRLFSLYADSGFPWEAYDDESDDWLHFDWRDFFKRHLKDGSVAIVYDLAFENYDMIFKSVAYNSKGQIIEMTDNLICDLSVSLGNQITKVVG